MPTYYIRLNFNAGKRGFSEGVYYDVTDAERAQIFSACYGLAYQRQFLTSSGVNIFSVSWSVVDGEGAPAETIFPNGEILENKGFSNNKPTPIPVGVSIYLRNYTDGGKRRWLFRGLPDEFIETAYPAKGAEIDPAVEAKLNEFLAYLVNPAQYPQPHGQPEELSGDFGMVTFADGAESVIFNVEEGSTADRALITTTAAHGLTLGDRVRILGIDQRLYPCILSTFYVVNVPNTTSFEIRYRVPSGLPQFNQPSARARALTLTFLDFEDHDPASTNRYTTRDTGRAHGTPRGRASASRC